jgi:hypothetical protein
MPQKFELDDVNVVVIIGSGAGGGAPFMVVINILWNLFSEL